MKPLLTTALVLALSNLALTTAARADDAAPGAAATCPASTAPFPPGADGNTHPEDVNVVTGDTADYAFADASGYVHAPIAKVLGALKDAKIVIDRRRVDAWSFPPFKDKNGFVVHNVVRGPAVVEFDMTWHRAVDGSESAPKQVCEVGSKTAGTQYIESLNQSVIVKAIDAHTTAVQIVSRLKAESAGKDDAAQYVRDVFASLLAKTHGKPLPEYKKE